MRRRAEAGVKRAGRRAGRAVDAVIRFEQDGPVKRVEIVLHTSNRRDLVSRGEARFYGLALTASLERLNAQIRTRRDSVKTSKRAGIARLAAQA